MKLADRVDNAALFLTCKDLAASGKERLACFRHAASEFQDVADGGISSAKKNLKRFGGYFGIANAGSQTVARTREREVRNRGGPSQPCSPGSDKDGWLDGLSSVCPPIRIS
jgi:hypothetical protein